MIDKNINTELFRTPLVTTLDLCLLLLILTHCCQSFGYDIISLTRFPPILEVFVQGCDKGLGRRPFVKSRYCTDKCSIDFLSLNSYI